jgi:lipopolysaccharide transport system permease protein
MKLFGERLYRVYLHRDILWDMALSQFKAKYAGSKLGIWWSVATPLILAASINFVFSTAFKVGIANHVILILSGILPWIFFNNALIEVTNSFSSSSCILSQGVFPRDLVPLSSILANLLNFLTGFVFLLPIFIVVNPKVIAFLPYLLVVILCHFIFIAGLGLLFSVINVFLRDLTYFLSAVFMIWFWITPVFYPLEMVAFPFKWVCLVNPLTYFILAYQQVLFYARMPTLPVLTALVLFAAVSFFAGYLVFIKREAALLKRI